MKMGNLSELKRFFKSIKYGVSAILMLAFVFTLSSCGIESDWSPYRSKAELNNTVLTYHASTVSGITIGDPTLTWELRVIEGNDFCTAQTKVGFVGQDFILKLETNNNTSERKAKVTILFSDGYTNTFTITQHEKTENSEYDRPWAEQPEYRDGAALLHKTYYTALNGKRVRNFSICYDTDKLVSHWVAYPIHDCYLGSISRTNEWSFDDAYYTYKNGSYTRNYIITEPEIPQEKQQNIAAGGYQTSGLDRGHMMPSASRLSTYEINAQTFYATNMMPQHSQFNQKIWATLEGEVRGWRCADTLFVITGTLYEGQLKTITARGRTIARPSHAYKIVLRTRKGNTGKHIANISSADDIKCIGFLFSNDDNGAATSMRDAAISVADIEKRSGFKFFRNLDSKIADEVKSQKNLSDWGL